MSCSKNRSDSQIPQCRGKNWPAINWYMLKKSFEANKTFKNKKQKKNPDCSEQRVLFLHFYRKKGFQFSPFLVIILILWLILEVTQFNEFRFQSIERNQLKLKNFLCCFMCEYFHNKTIILRFLRFLFIHLDLLITPFFSALWVIILCFAADKNF